MRGKPSRRKEAEAESLAGDDMARVDMSGPYKNALSAALYAAGSMLGSDTLQLARVMASDFRVSSQPR